MLIIASRQRAKKVARFMRAMTACGSRVPFVVVIDEVDGTKAEYRALGCDLIVAPGDNGGAGKYRHAVEVLGRRAWYGMYPDDGEPQSDKWGEGLIDAARGGFVGFANDQFLAPGGFYALPFLPGYIVDDIGIVPPPVRHFKTDSFWDRFARDTRRACYLKGEVCRLTDNIAGLPHDGPKVEVKAAYQKDDIKIYGRFMIGDIYADAVKRWKR